MDFWSKIKKPIIGLAPMDGVTDYPTRQIQCSISKPDVMFTEFISVEGFTRKPEVFEKNLFFKENERPIIVQLFGHTPQLFYESILKIAEKKFNGIDLNMGCPAKSVLERGSGGALIGNNELAEKIIEKSYEAIQKSNKNVPLSVKTRIGRNEACTDKWIRFLCQFPLSEITIHGRFLKHGNSGSVNWDEIKTSGQICRQKGIVCLGNGGVKSISEAKEKSEKYGLDGVLIGQAACGNPWVFKEDHIPSKEEILGIIIQHAKLVEEFYDEKQFVTILKHFSWYPRHFSNSKKLKIELLKTRTLKEVEEIVANFS